MDWRSHAIIGTLLAALALYLMNVKFESIIFLSIFAGFSALLPDIDHKMSKIRSIADKSFVLFALVYSYNSCSNCQLLEIGKTAILLIGIYFLIITFLRPRHRGITHSLFFVVIYGAILYLLFNFNLAIAGIIGYASHLIADKEIKLI
ncbi:metal-dependent hydrolase [Candidatus Micrarchaeota archaeon]|nr:metal-dependent hydrolase [Candidatus Micrarchaeota archaeon]